MEIPVNGLLRSTPGAFYPSKLFAKTQRRKKTEVLIEPFIRKQLRLKAHTVTTTIGKSLLRTAFIQNRRFAVFPRASG
jgi:hypothetical protein